MNIYKQAYENLHGPLSKLTIGGRSGGKQFYMDNFNILELGMLKAEKYDKKETPMKPKIIYDDFEGEYGERLSQAEYCPVCNEELTNVGGAYCHGCGQRINWRPE